jgi:AmiR/NasT family two-component response regulator
LNATQPGCNIRRAKSILMAAQGFWDEDAHQAVHRNEMAKNVPVEGTVFAIISANQLLNFTWKSP